MKVYRVTFEDYRDIENIVHEHQYVLADNIGQVWRNMGHEGDGYDKEMIAVQEVIEAVRALKED